MFLWCVQEVAELNKEDLPSVISDTASTLSESQYIHVHKLCPLLYTAGTEDLFDIEMALKNLNKWQSLGLALGLLYPTLERIEEEQRGDIEKSKRKMIAAWLKQQDNVSKKGDPSWAVLQTALKNIEEKELASNLMVSCSRCGLSVCLYQLHLLHIQRKRRTLQY